MHLRRRRGHPQGFRQDNPAGDAIGAARLKNGVAKKHHRAPPHAEVAAATATVRASDANWATIAAIEFLILTASRSGEMRKARWEEVDLETATWSVPADRMKMHLEHPVPLSRRALQFLVESRKMADGSGVIFPSVTGRPMSGNTLPKLLREEGIPAVVHGFRSSFQDWCAEC